MIAKLIPCVLGALLLGCGSASRDELPETYPVSGTIVNANGKKLTEGRLTFHSTSAPGLSVTGTVGPDGTFTLETARQDQRRAGAPAGQFNVTYIRQRDGTRMEVIHLPEPVTIEAQTNELKLTLR